VHACDSGAGAPFGTSRLVHRVNGSDVIGLLVAAAFFVAMFLVAFWIAESLIVSVAKKAARAIDEDPVVIALKAIVLNALSVAAAYGILVLVFQDGIGRGLIGASSGGIESFMPMFLFVILFGLSMDYHVFMISRIREGVDHGMSTDEAVEHGIKTTAGVVTSAAIVMVLVFSVFITLSFDLLKQFGVGLAAAVLIDETIIRGVLLPASMKLLGDWNWYLLSWLEWLPRVAVATEPEPIAGTLPMPAAR
jgi:uncharacterized membrane protein YdfJ with MMPL/SSD domain